MSNYFEALVFVHAFAPDIFSYRSIGFADVGAIAVISRALLCMHFEILLDLIADEYERLDLSERDARRASALCVCL